MFWKKKKHISVIDELFNNAVVTSVPFHVDLVEIFPDSILLREKSEHFTFYFVIASSVTGLFGLHKDQFEKHYSQLLSVLQNWDDQGFQAADDFINFVLKGSLMTDTDLHAAIAIWLYYNVKETTDVILEETGPFMTTGKYIVQEYENWLIKQY